MHGRRYNFREYRIAFRVPAFNREEAQRGAMARVGAYVGSALRRKGREEDEERGRREARVRRAGARSRKIRARRRGKG